MRRDLSQLTARPFDLLVVGGGIVGLMTAYDAAQRGLSVALVERDDFGSGASFNHLRTIHGGLRYLQTLDLRRARESVGERRTIARIAPHLVQPLPFVIPIYRSLTKGRLAMRAGFLLDRLVARGRNRGVAPALRLPAGRVISRHEAIERFPGLRRQHLAGAGLYYDLATTESDRLTFSVALAAVEHGAVLANHVRAEAALVENARVVGVRAADTLGGGSFEIRASLTINAAGAGVDTILAPAGASARIPLLKAMNLVTRREATGEALGGRSAAGRYLFLVPWRGRALFGTWESPATARPDEPVDPREVADFIRELNEAFPSLDLSPADVTLVHRGIVPAAVHAGGRLSLEGHEQVRDHAAEGLGGLITVAGAKYTTGRAVGERMTNLAFARLGRPAVACRTADTPLPGGDLVDAATAIGTARGSYEDQVPSDAIPHLVAAYGSRVDQVLAIAGGNLDLFQRVAADSPVIGAELAWAARHEMAETLVDAVVRRTPLGVLGYPGDAAAERAAAIVGAEKGWSDARRRSELDALRAFYRTS